jgi:hypothetical protein
LAKGVSGYRASREPSGYAAEASEFQTRREQTGIRPAADFGELSRVEPLGSLLARVGMVHSFREKPTNRRKFDGSIRKNSRRMVIRLLQWPPDASDV